MYPRITIPVSSIIEMRCHGSEDIKSRTDFTEEHRDDQGYHFIKYRQLAGVAAGR